ncbi:hypothetical protein [Methanoregula sp.]|jgi:hypothetical protein|uniref:hypothetical protein n=1 Tax=Methanoregula sp. TaxID=2052170 RepID=UPI003C210D57
MTRIPTEIQNYGILNPRTRQYLQTRNTEKPRDEDEKNRQKQYDYRIKRHAKQALKDLALVAAAYHEKRTRDIFSINDLTNLVSAVVYKNGNDVTDHGPYYHVLIDAIIAAMNASPNGAITHLKFHIEPQLYSTKDGNRAPDLTNLYAKRVAESMKK